MKMYHNFLCCYQHAPTEFLVAPSECFGTPRTRFESVPWFVSCHLCEHSHRFHHRHYIIYPRNKWPLRLSYFYVTVITLFWQQNVTVILTQKFLSVLCRSWAPICHIKNHSKCYICHNPVYVCYYTHICINQWKPASYHSNCHRQSPCFDNRNGRYGYLDTAQWHWKRIITLSY